MSPKFITFCINLFSPASLFITCGCILQSHDKHQPRPPPADVVYSAWRREVAGPAASVFNGNRSGVFNHQGLGGASRRSGRAQGAGFDPGAIRPITSAFASASGQRLAHVIIDDGPSLIAYGWPWQEEQQASSKEEWWWKSGCERSVAFAFCLHNLRWFHMFLGFVF